MEEIQQEYINMLIKMEFLMPLVNNILPKILATSVEPLIFAEIAQDQLLLLERMVLISVGLFRLNIIMLLTTMA